MAQKIDHSPEIAEGIRNLLLGRVRLKADYAAGDRVVKVGYESGYWPNSEPVPGAYLWFNNTDEARLVQPTAQHIAGGIEYSEDVTITDASGCHAIIYPPATHNYTTARKAYLCLRTPPIPDLKVIATDPESLPPDEIQEKWFPSVTIIRRQFTPTFRPSTAVEGKYRFVIRYACLVTSGESSGDKLLQDTATIVNLFAEDPYIGATVENCDIEGVESFRFRRISANRTMLLGDIYLAIERTSAYTKLGT